MNESARRERLPVLTSLRFFAAAAIVVYHSQGRFGIPQFGHGVIFAQAVTFFFVLSGFVLAYAYPQLIGARAKGRFLVARFARLWPTHALAVALIYGISAGWGVAEPRILLLNLAMAHAWTPGSDHVFSWNGCSWSVSVEMGLYFSFLWLIHRWEKTSYLKLGLTFGLVLAIGFAMNRAFPVPDQCGPQEQSLIYAVMAHNPFSRLFEFALGMMAASLHRRIAARPPMGRGLGTAVELIAVSVLAVQLTLILPLVQKLFPWVGIPGSHWLVSSGGCFASSFVILVLSLQRGWLSRALSVWPLVLLGEMSFALYMLHQIVQLCYDLWFRSFIGWSEPALLALYVTTLAVGSYLVLRLYERPLRSLIVKTADRVLAASWRVPALPEINMLPRVGVRTKWRASSPTTN